MTSEQGNGKCHPMFDTDVVEWPLEEVRPEPGFVCFIQADIGGPVRIGWARNPRRRLSELQVGNPHKLLLLGVHPGSKETAKDLKERLKSHHLQGEWFSPCKAITRLCGAKPSQIADRRELKLLLKRATDQAFRRGYAEARKRLKDELAEREREYWEERFRENPEVLALHREDKAVFLVGKAYEPMPWKDPERIRGNGTAWARRQTPRHQSLPTRQPKDEH